MTNSEPELFNSEPSRLARLLGLDAKGGLRWHESELGAVWRHQLLAPLDLSAGVPSPSPGAVPEARGSAPCLPRTLGELFHDPHPPLDLLAMAKQYGQAHLHHQSNELPREIAEVIYYLSIGVARLRRQERLSRLPDEEVARGLTWALTLCWLDDPTRQILRQSLGCLLERNANDGGTAATQEHSEEGRS